MSNPSVSNSCQFGFHRKPPPQGRFSSALPPIHGISGCLSIPPTYHPYINESVWASEKCTKKSSSKWLIAWHLLVRIFTWKFRISKPKNSRKILQFDCKKPSVLRTFRLWICQFWDVSGDCNVLFYRLKNFKGSSTFTHTHQCCCLKIRTFRRVFIVLLIHEKEVQSLLSTAADE